MERFNVSDNGKIALLELLHFLLSENNLPKSKEKFDYIFKKGNIVKIDKYCLHCCALTKEIVCENASCILFNKKVNTFNYYSHCKLAPQIKEFMSHYFEDYERHVFNHTSDITRCNYYNRIHVNQQKPSLNLVVATDGISLVNSANFECWPVFCSILELPYR